MSQLTSAAGFRPELGLPWLTYSLRGLSPEQIEQKLRDCLSFRFNTDEMAPAFPEGTQVVLRPVGCACQVQVGKVYVLLSKTDKRVVAYGRLRERYDVAGGQGWGFYFYLHHEQPMAEAPQEYKWPHPNYHLYALAYYGSVEVTAL